MINTVKKEQDTQGACKGPQKQDLSVFSLSPEGLFSGLQYGEGDDKAYQIPEQGLLKGGQIPGKFDKSGHKREKKG